MNDISKINKCLIYLMTCTLRNAAPREEAVRDMDVGQLLITAKKHSVASMVYIALEKTDAFAAADEAVRRQWQELRDKAVRKNILLGNECSEIMHELETAGIRHMPLKGSILKNWYPKSGMREMADCDIFIDASRRDDVRDIFAERGYEIKSYNKSNHDIYEKSPVYNFEMHVKLFPDGLFDVPAGTWAEGLWDRLLPIEGTAYRYRFTPEDFYVFALAHAYKHFSHSGTGIRTLADIFVMNRHLSSSADRAGIGRKLFALGIAEYERNSRLLSEKMFGCGFAQDEAGNIYEMSSGKVAETAVGNSIGEFMTNCRFSSVTSLSKEETELLNYYLHAGTYGNLDNRVSNKLHEIQNDSSDITKLTKIRYCMRRLFPDKNFCKDAYPFVYSHPYVLPAFWIWRVAHVLRVRRKSILCEITAVHRKDIKNMKIKDDI